MKVQFNLHSLHLPSERFAISSARFRSTSGIVPSPIASLCLSLLLSGAGDPFLGVLPALLFDAATSPPWFLCGPDRPGAVAGG